jgi:aspartyl-tRNA synthetase
VCNGFEIASGSIRNHLAGDDGQGLRDAGLSRADVEERSAASTARSSTARRRMAAWRLRRRPHRDAAGRRKNLREITLFPMNQQARTC